MSAPKEDGQNEGTEVISLSHSLTYPNIQPTDEDWLCGQIDGGTVQVTILDNYAIIINPTSLSLSEQLVDSDTYTVQLSKQPEADVDVAIQSDGQTIVDSDLLTFTPGDWAVQTVTVTVVDDSDGEADPHASIVRHNVPLDITWDTTLYALDEFNSDPGNLWYDGTITDEPEDPNCVVEDGVLKVYGSTMAAVPGDYDPATAIYKLTVINDMGDHGYQVFGVRNDGVQAAAEECQKVGAELLFVTEPLDTSPEGQLIAYVKGYAAQLEREKIKDRAIRGQRARAEQGRLPHGDGGGPRQLGSVPMQSFTKFVQPVPLDVGPGYCIDTLLVQEGQSRHEKCG